MLFVPGRAVFESLTEPGHWEPMTSMSIKVTGTDCRELTSLALKAAGTMGTIG